MEIDRLKADLESSDSQKRLKAITELRSYDTELAVPLLLSKMRDQEFLVRSFVAMGLGRKRNSDSFAALLELIKFDRDPNVRAEAANSLSLFGQVSASHLTLMFSQDDHWLVRRSIIAALAELDCPEEFFEVCVRGLQGEDFTVREASVQCLARFAGTAKQDAALAQLLPLINADEWRIRMQAAKALTQFKEPQAEQALIKLREDKDHRVVAAVLEGLV